LIDGAPTWRAFFCLIITIGASFVKPQLVSWQRTLDIITINKTFFVFLLFKSMIKELGKNSLMLVLNLNIVHPCKISLNVMKLKNKKHRTFWENTSLFLTTYLNKRGI
jgi:hypothetical protein